MFQMENRLKIEAIKIETTAKKLIGSLEPTEPVPTEPLWFMVAAQNELSHHIRRLFGYTGLLWEFSLYIFDERNFATSDPLFLHSVLVANDGFLSTFTGT